MTDATRFLASDAVVTIGAESNISADTFIALTQGTTFGLQVAARMATASIPSHTQPPSSARVREGIEFSRVQYGSPAQFFIDLEPMLAMMKENGFVIFTGIALAFFKTGASIWKTMEDARFARAQRRSLTRSNDPGESIIVRPDGGLEIGPDPFPTTEQLKADIMPTAVDLEVLEPLAKIVEKENGDTQAAMAAGFQTIKSLSHREVLRIMAEHPDQQIEFR
ncbi:hypothetical protein MRBLMI12_000256 [Microbacterium sp. LMI12-1-1.1]|uniref:hypothetical protein n=1 Tax=Microbacterium sp. LMI12-1-1.1 TaxID=3135225 RepID=UPI00344096ED